MFSLAAGAVFHTFFGLVRTHISMRSFQNVTIQHGSRGGEWQSTKRKTVGAQTRGGTMEGGEQAHFLGKQASKRAREIIRAKSPELTNNVSKCLDPHLKETTYLLRFRK